MIVGFTGTRQGMTLRQKARITWLLQVWQYDITAAHHGDCLGSDEDFHRMCVVYAIDIVIHPPTNEKYRAHCERIDDAGVMVRVLPAKPYIPRNHDIVNACGLLLATPRDSKRPASLRGEGTWSTISYAERSDTPVDIIKP